MRRIVVFILTLSVLLCAAVPAAAEELDPLRSAIVESYYSDEITDLTPDGARGQDSLKPVDLRMWQITPEELRLIHDELYYKGYIPWFSGSNYHYQYSDGIVLTYTPMVMDVDNHSRELYEQKIAELMAEACLPGMTDWQLALSVHDYIVLHIAYDLTYEKTSGYEGLVNGTTVCNGYALLYMDVMNRLGIPCHMVICEDTGDGSGHGWNMIQLDGQWYHVDPTWGDPTPDTYGYVNHDHFLKTDEEFLHGENAHDFGWEAYEQTPVEPFTADDILEDSASTFCFVDGQTAVYRFEGESTQQIWRMDMTTGEEHRIYAFDYLPMDLGDGTYWYPTRGINYWNGRIYFNREDAVMSMLPDGSDVQEEFYWYPEDQYIFGSFVDDGIMYLTLADSDFNKTSIEVPLEGVQYHTHSYETYTVEPTCSEAGYSEQHCSCGITCNYKQIPQLEHELMFDSVQEATQEETGLVWIHCYNCDYEQWDETPKLKPTVETVLEEHVDYLPMAACAGLVVLIVSAIGGKRRKNR